MARIAAIEPVSGISIAIPLALLVALSVAVAVQSGSLVTTSPDGAVAAPQTVVIAPHGFAYRDATEYFRNGLAVDAPKLDREVTTTLEIMKYQTTLRDYNRCVADARCEPAEQRYDTLSEEKIPATGVSYDDAVRYAAWLSERTGAEWRLPSDFELAYAAADRFPDDALGIDPEPGKPLACGLRTRSPQGCSDRPTPAAAGLVRNQPNRTGRFRRQRLGVDFDLQQTDRSR
ncbi:UNVERIFIED_ORG: formylglycine-generating enzyme required for sulfatase activity [Rhizobium aethiopicum]